MLTSNFTLARQDGLHSQAMQMQPPSLSCALLLLGLQLRLCNARPTHPTNPPVLADWGASHLQSLDTYATPQLVLDMYSSKTPCAL
eukprot:341081-Amphidinium_carterae.1